MSRATSDMRSIKRAAKSEFGCLRGVEGFGLGEHSLRIYIHDASVRQNLPAVFHGVQVDIVVVGDISAEGKDTFGESLP